jgi:hypothetical protein
MRSGRIPYSRALNESPPSEANARKALRTIATALVDRRGRIQGGYLKLSDSGSGRLRAGGFFTSGHASLATDSIRSLVRAAYGKALGPAANQRLEEALNAYLARTRGAIGTRSFVKLVQSLEQRIPEDDGQSPPVQGPADIRSRLDLETVAAEPTPREIVRKRVADLAQERRSPITDRALRQFQDLAVLMDQAPRAFDQFKHIMFPSPSALGGVAGVSETGAPRTFAMGDADGSMARMVLHAIASGVAELPHGSLRRLGFVMSVEARAMSRAANGSERRELKKIQADPKVSEALDTLADDVQVLPGAQEGRPACIFLGDILSDRFTNNQPAMARFIYKLSGVDQQDPSRRVETGVRFIAGNHDTSPLLDQSGRSVFDPKGSHAYQWGAFAARKLGWSDYQAVLRDCFRAADYRNGVLTTHNGVARGERPGEYLVALGDFESREDENSAQGTKVKSATRVQARHPKELAEQMNRIFLDRVRAGDFEDVIATDFRVKDHEMTPVALGFDQVPGFRQIHGHESNMNEASPGVTNLNARDQKGEYLPAAMVID